MKLTSRNVKERKEELLIVILLSAFLFVLVSVLLIINMYPFATTDKRVLKAPPIEITSESKGLIFGADDDQKPILNVYELSVENPERLTVKNPTENNVELSLFFSSNIKASPLEDRENPASLVASSGKVTVTLKANESAYIKLTSRKENESFKPHVIVTSEENTVNYLSSKSEFLDAVSKDNKAREVVLMDDIFFEDEKDIIIEKSCAVFVGNHTLSTGGRIIFDYAEEGTFQISGGENTITAKGFIVNAPLSSVIVEYPFYDIPKEKLGYYITARKYNSKHLRAVEYPVYTNEELIVLADDKQYPKLFDTAEVILTLPLL